MSELKTDKLGFYVRLRENFDVVRTKAVDALKNEGFGVLTEIDVKETLKQKLDVNFPSYTILGACNPPLAYRALNAAPEVGLLLPCNVTVREVGDGNVEVALIDPMMMVESIGKTELSPVAEDAHARLERIARKLAV